MDYGAYGSYPKYTRKRYNTGRYIKRKYGGNYRYSSKRINPINQYSYKKTRVGRLTKTAMNSTICTYTGRVNLLSGSDTYVFPSGNQFLNLATMLAGSAEFISRFTQYSYYKISGMSVKLTRRWIDPIVTGANSFSNLIAGLSMMSVNFYPNLSSTAVGQPVENADSSWKVSPFLHGVQTHYQPFPRDFTTGSNSNGLGVWNACATYTSISGELAIYNDGGVAAQGSDLGIWDMEVDFYITFCNNTGA